MPSQRERIYEEFLGTPKKEQADFCRRLFLLHLQATGDAQSLEDRMAHLLTALEQAIVEDAGRPELWQHFQVWLHEQLKPLQQEQQKKNEELVRKRRRDS
jgi:hypothetical protein